MKFIKKNKKQIKFKKYNYLIPRDVKHIDYKNVALLQKFINNQGKIIPASNSGLTARQQRALTIAIKRARHMALLPYIKERVRT